MRSIKNRVVESIQRNQDLRLIGGNRHRLLHADFPRIPGQRQSDQLRGKPLRFDGKRPGEQRTKILLVVVCNFQCPDSGWVFAVQGQQEAFRTELPGEWRSAQKNTPQRGIVKRGVRHERLVIVEVCYQFNTSPSRTDQVNIQVGKPSVCQTQRDIDVTQPGILCRNGDLRGRLVEIQNRLRRRI